MQFQFTLDRQVVQDWSDSPTWSWTATEGQAGLHVVAAKVRDSKHNPASSYDSAVGMNFALLTPIVTLQSELTSIENTLKTAPYDENAKIKITQLIDKNIDASFRDF